MLKRLKDKLSAFKNKHPDVYEFILFNIMSNVATITNFVTLWIFSSWIFKKLSNDFAWFIFNYESSQGGLGAFLSFLIAYTAAQIVNFIVQRKIVFGATVNVMKTLPWYILTVVTAGIVSVWLPPYVITIVQPYTKTFAATIANAVNILVQVLINYPMLKFVIMKKGNE